MSGLRRISRTTARRAHDAAGMSNWIVSHPWVYPMPEVQHILGIALLVGNLVLLELRVWGFGRALPGIVVMILGRWIAYR